MANHQESQVFSFPILSPSSSFGAGPCTSGASTSHQDDPSRANIMHLILALNDSHTRERALYLLDKSRGICEDLALLLWDSPSTITALLQEIIGVYALISSQNLTERASNRVCSALALFQCVASHRDTRPQFLNVLLGVVLRLSMAQSDQENKERPYEHVRLTGLGVIGSLVKTGDEKAIVHLLQSEVFPCCLRCMEVGGELTKTVATFIVHKILVSDEGLRYCCTFAQRFYAVSHSLRYMLENRAELPGKRLLKYIIYCYLRLSHSPRARDSLRVCLPAVLRDPRIIVILHDDPTTVGFLQQLLYNISMEHDTVV